MTRRKSNFILHGHPISVREIVLKFSTTWGLGIFCVASIFILTLSGLMLMMYYIPHPSYAYTSMLHIEHSVSFGHTIRLLHRFAGHGFVLLLLLHVVRVIWRAAYIKRQMNWLVGLSLGGVGIGLAFTGYLLPWDQTAYWAVRVSTHFFDYLPGVGAHLKHILLGADQLNEASLIRFYTLHVAILPILFFLLMFYHFWRLRIDGGLVIDRDSPLSSHLINAWPHLIYREVVLLVLVLNVFLLSTLLFDAPLGQMVDTQLPSNPEKAPWYFLGLQEMISHSTWLGALVIPSTLLAFLILLPFFPKKLLQESTATPTRHFSRYFILAVLMGVICYPVGLIVSQGDHAYIGFLNPVSFSYVVTCGVFVFVGWQSKNIRLAGLCVLVLLVCLWIWATLVGVSRGPNWVLYLPGQEWPGGF